MKLRFALLLCLIALFNCNCDVKETITCLLSNKKVLDIGIKLIIPKRISANNSYNY